jgi:hypothetical protein
VRVRSYDRHAGFLLIDVQAGYLIDVVAERSGHS